MEAGKWGNGRAERVRVAARGRGRVGGAQWGVRWGCGWEWEVDGVEVGALGGQEVGGGRCGMDAGAGGESRWDEVEDEAGRAVNRVVEVRLGGGRGQEVDGWWGVR